MRHRHLTHQQLTLAAIDDIILRGKKPDWLTLRLAALRNRQILEKVLRICSTRITDPYAQRYHFWYHYAKKHLA
jgi:hypothetical protein